MTGTCIACGRTGKVQRHHPGRRAHTTLTVPACQDCHTVLTIWDGGRTGERHWSPGTPDVIRLKAGIADVLNLACIRSGWLDTASDAEQIISDFRSLFTIRYSATDTAYAIRQVTPDNREQQLAEIRGMIGAYLLCR